MRPRRTLVAQIQPNPYSFLLDIKPIWKRSVRFYTRLVLLSVIWIIEEDVYFNVFVGRRILCQIPEDKIHWDLRRDWGQYRRSVCDGSTWDQCQIWCRCSTIVWWLGWNSSFGTYEITINFLVFRLFTRSKCVWQIYMFVLINSFVNTLFVPWNMTGILFNSQIYSSNSRNFVAFLIKHFKVLIYVDYWFQ
jgi:hypothetical protein